MSALETFLKRYLDGENYAPHCFEFYETGYLDGEVFQFQITKSLEQQIQGHVLEVLKLREELAHIKQNYTLCEKEPDSHKDVHINGKWKTVPLYREAK
jgi:hypothetical protein